MKKPEHGHLVLDKPTGITSRAALNMVQRWFPRGTRLGHAGTLDPLATGVLVVCVGAATRLVEYVQRMDKEYVATLVLGATSDTDDADGQITPTACAVPVNTESVQSALGQFLGKIDQVPPAFSAAKVDGARAHALARRGEKLELAARQVRIDALDILHYAYPELVLRIRCGKGTYVRSVARDLGQRLGCGAYVRVLRRERIGPFTPSMAMPLEPPPALPVPLLPQELAVAGLPRAQVDREQADRLAQGQALHLEAIQLLDAAPQADVAIFMHDCFIAIGRWDPTVRCLAPGKVFRRANDDGG